MDEILTKRPYRSWDHDDKARVVAEANRILASDPSIKPLALIKQAQLVLDEDKQRRITHVNTDAYKWFHDGIAGAPAAPPPPKQAPPPAPPKPEPVPEPVPPPQPDPEPCKCRPGSNEVSAPIPVIPELGDVSVLEVFKMVVGAMRETNQAVVTLGQSLTRQFDDIKAELKAVREANRQVVVAKAPTGEMPEEVRRELKRVGDIMDNLLGRVATIAQNTSRMPAALPAERFVQPPAAQAPNKNGTKPKVLILGIDSGHWQKHIKDAVSGRCQVLKFDLVSGEAKPYSDYDKVIVTKKVPDAWLKTAKDFLANDPRWSKVSGACHEITIALRKMLDEWEGQ